MSKTDFRSVERSQRLLYKVAAGRLKGTALVSCISAIAGLLSLDAGAADRAVNGVGALPSVSSDTTLQITLPAAGTLTVSGSIYVAAGISVLPSSKAVTVNTAASGLWADSTDIRVGTISAATGTQITFGSGPVLDLRALKLNPGGEGGTIVLRGSVGDEIDPDTLVPVAPGELSISGGTVVLQPDTLNSLSYSGLTELKGGRLVIANMYGLGASSSLTITGGTLTADVPEDPSTSFGRTVTQNVSLKGDAQFGDVGADRLILSGTVDLGGGKRKITVLGVLELSGNDSELADGVVTVGTVSTSSAGTLVKAGFGTLVLGAANSYSGGTVIQEGTVLASVEQALGGKRPSGSVAGGSLSMEGGVLLLGAPQVVSGLSISGGEISVDPSADPAYAGSLTVSGSGSTTIHANVSQSASISVNVMESLSSGSLGLLKTGSGVLSLTGANGYRGDTVVKAGSIRVTGGDSNGYGPLGKSGVGTVVLDGGALYADSGAGSTIDLVKGVSVLSSSRMIASGGGLRVGATTVAVGGTLQTLGKIETGAFNLQGRLVLSGEDPLKVASLIAPSGSSVVWDKPLQAAGMPVGIVVSGTARTDLSNLKVEISPDFVQKAAVQSGSVTTGTTKTLVGTLVSVAGSLTAPTQLISGASLPTQPVGFLTFSLSSGSASSGGSVDIVMERNYTTTTTPTTTGGTTSQTVVTPPSAPTPAPANNQSFVNALQNSGAVATAVDVALAKAGLTSRGQLASVINALNAGNTFASTAGVSVLETLAISNAVDGRLDSISASSSVGAPVFSLGAKVGDGKSGSQPTMSTVSGSKGEDKMWKVWTTAYGSWSHVGGYAPGNFKAVSASGGGGMLGVDRQFGSAVGGLVVSAGEGQTHLGDNSYKVRSDSWSLGGYGSILIGNVVLDGTAMWGNTEQDSRREVLGTIAKAKYSTHDWSLGSGVSVNLLAPETGWKLAPVARIKYVNSKEDAFTETGSPFWNSSRGQDREHLLSKLGLYAGRFGNISERVRLGLDGASYWVHDYSSGSRRMDYQIGGVSYSVRSRAGASDSMQMNLGLSATFSEALSLRLSGQHEMAQDRRQTTGLFSVSMMF